MHSIEFFVKKSPIIFNKALLSVETKIFTIQLIFDTT